MVAQVLQTHYRTRLRDGGAGSRAEGSAAGPLCVVSMVYHFSEASELSVVRSDPLWRLAVVSGHAADEPRQLAVGCSKPEGVALCGIRCHRWHGV